MKGSQFTETTYPTRHSFFIKPIAVSVNSSGRGGVGMSSDLSWPSVVSLTLQRRKGSWVGNRLITVSMQGRRFLWRVEKKKKKEMNFTIYQH